MDDYHQPCSSSKDNTTTFSGQEDDTGDVPGLAQETGSLHLLTDAVKRENVAVPSEETGCLCGDETAKYQLTKLEMQEKEADARLLEMEHRLTLSESKLRSCNDLLELVQLLKNRIQLVYEAGAGQGASPGNVAPPTSDVQAGPGPVQHVSPIRSPKSPIRTPKSPRSN